MANTSKSARDNRANQLNPIHPAYHRSRGASSTEAQHMAELSASHGVEQKSHAQREASSSDSGSEKSE